MKRPTRILLFTVAGILLLTFGWFVLRPREPSYQGKTLTEWLQEADDIFVYPDADAQAVSAIHHIGSNAVPTLVRYLAAPKDSPLKETVLKWDEHYPQFSLRVIPQAKKQELAAHGFEVLGKDAKSAVPELIQLLKDDDGLVRMNAAGCLGLIGPAAQSAVPDLIKEFEREKSIATNQYFVTTFALGRIGPSAQAAIPSLKAGLTNNSAECRKRSQIALINIHATPISPIIEQLKDTTNVSQWNAARAIALHCGTNAIPAVPVFISELNCTNATVQSESLSALGTLHLEPQACVPAVVPFLTSKDDYLRENAIDVLRSFGPAAKSAWPELLQRCWSDPNNSVRDSAARALREIDPEAAAKAGIK